MTNQRAHLTSREERETPGDAVGAATTTDRPEESAAATAQAGSPQGVMASGEAEAGGPVDEEEFPWEKVIKWGLTVLAVGVVLYLIFRRKD